MNRFGEHGAYGARIARMAERLRLAGVFYAVGWRSDAGDIVAASDVVILTSDGEPSGRVILEAMAAGRPVTAFDSGGTREMVVEGKTGLLVSGADVEALAGAFRRLGGDAELREAMGRAGAARARETFSLERHLARMEAILTRAARRAKT